MEMFLILVLGISTLLLFVKWRQAVAEIEGFQAGPKFKTGSDPVFTVLQRIETKVDILALARKMEAAPEPAQGRATAAVPVTPMEPSGSMAGAASPSRPEASPAQAAPEPDSKPAPESKSEPIPKAIPETAPVSSEAPQPKPPDFKSFPEAPVPAWEREARVILGKIWSWLLVGEEHRPKGVSLEFAMAGTWLMRVGVVVLVSCVVWFLKWSMVHGILGPSGRVGLSFAAGIALTVAGYRLMGKRYQVMGQGLMGGGIAALYFAAYAAGPLYHLIPQLGCFAMMALITLAGCVLASGTRSQVTAILAMMGGYATPVLLSTGHANFPGLYGYMFLLGGGILGLAIYRNWRLLHYLAFVAHWVLIFGSLRGYRPEEHFSVVLPFLVLFFVQQHGVNMGYAFRRAVPISILEAVHQFLHAGLFAAVAYYLIDQSADRPWPALLAIGLGSVFVAQTLIVLRRMRTDRLSLSVSLGLAGFFTAWSVPLLFDGSSLTVAWSLMALAWLWSGLRIRSQLLILGSQVLFVLAGLRLGIIDFPAFLQGGPDVTFGEYLHGFGLRLIRFGVFIASLFAASAMYRHRASLADDSAGEGKGLRVAPEADLPFATPMRTAGLTAFLAGFLFLFVTVHFEAVRLLGFHVPLRAPGIILVWTAFAAYLVLRFRKSGSVNLAALAGSAIVLVCLRMIFVDWREMGFNGLNWRFEDAGLQIAYRCFAHAALVVLLWNFGRGRFTPHGNLPMARAYRVAAVALVFLMATLETRTVFGEFVPGFQAGALSVVWALFAMALVGMGLRFDDRMSRLTGLVLFALVAVKVFLFDLSSLDMIWRVLSFLSVGAVLLLGSFAYLRASRPDTAVEPPVPEKEPA
jgi:uncharacterized membrane protein